MPTAKSSRWNACATALGEPGPDGRRSPAAHPRQRVPDRTCDSVIVAVGQRPTSTFLTAAACRCRNDGGIAIDSDDALRRPGRASTRAAMPWSWAGEHHRGLRRRPPRGRGDLRPPRREVRSAARDVPTLSEQDILEVKAVRAREGAAGQAATCCRSQTARQLRPDRADLHRRMRRAAKRSAACSAPRSATSAWKCAPTGPTTPS